MQVELNDGRVWLTTSDFEDRDCVVHGVFTSKEYAERCAADVRQLYPKRNVCVGAWLMNEGWSAISDGRLGT